MANLQLLRKRLKSVKATGKTAEAMKTSASIKYSKLSRRLTSFSAYENGCRDMLALVGGSGIERDCSEPQPRDCLILLSSNRGFCGGFNNELFRFFETERADLSDPRIIVYGKKAARYCAERGLAFEESDLPDVPAFETAKVLTERALELYRSGEAARVFVVYQKYVNMLTQTPAREQILPVETDAGTARKDLLFLPDAETLGESLAVSCLCSRVYGILLSHSSGAQAATLVAMRNACDNAEESAASLEMTINRIRQAEVTNSVIETSSGAAFRNSES